MRPYTAAFQSRGLREYLIPFFRHKYKVLIVFLVATTVLSAGAFAYFKFIMKPLFEARSSILVKVGWENFTPDLAMETRRTSSVSAADILSSEVRILQSRELKERAIRTVGLENLYPEFIHTPPRDLTPVEAAIIQFGKDLTVKPAAKGNIVEVYYNNQNAATAAKALNSLVAFYLEKRIEAYKDPKSAMFLEKKAEEYRQKVQEAESRLKSFQEEAGIISYEEQRTILLNQKNAVDSALKGTYNQLKEGRQKLAELDKVLKSIPRNVVTPGIKDRMGEMESRLLALQLQEKELLAKYTEDNRLVANVRTQMEMVKQFMDKQKAANAPSDITSPDPIFQEIQRQMLQIQTELSGLEVRAAELEQQFRAADADLRSLEARGFRHKSLTRDLATNEERLHTYQQRLEDARVLDELERQKMTSVTIIEPAAVPSLPVNAPRPFILYAAIAVVLGLGCGLGLAFLLDFLNQSITTPLEAERRTGLQVLAAVNYKE
jgi:uncharacterized protein involved in exopolysaccharide biosynthesis